MAFEKVFCDMIVEMVVNFYKNYHETITIKNSVLTLVLPERDFELEYSKEEDEVDKSVLKTLSADFSAFRYLSKIPPSLSNLFKDDLEVLVVNDGSETYLGINNFLIANSEFQKNGLDLDKLLQYCEDVYLGKTTCVNHLNLSDIYPKINGWLFLLRQRVYSCLFYWVKIVNYYHWFFDKKFNIIYNWIAWIY